MASKKNQLKKLNEETEEEKEAKAIAEFAQFPPIEAMAGVQVQMTAPGRHFGNDHVKGVMSNGALHLYYNLEPRDAVEQMLSTLAVSVASASLDCLTQAANANPGWIEGRDLNLRHGFRGAAVAAELIKALDARRGIGPKKVTVGNVNVEAGGQAIVGNVESRRLQDSPEPSGSEVVVERNQPKTLEP